jgi:biotin operon repressor
MIQINDDLLNQLISNPVFKTDTRAIFFLLQNQEPVSSDDIAAATGLSRKCANKATKRLTTAGLIIPGLPEARKRSFDVTGGEQIEPQEVTEGTTGEPSGTFTERFNRLESMIGTLMDTLGAVLNPAPLRDGQNETGKVSHLSCMENSELINGQNRIEAVIIPATDGQNETLSMPVYSHVDQQENTQDKKETVSIPKGTIGTEPGTKGPVNDSIIADLDNAIIRAHARQAALASLLKEKQKQSSFSDTCTPASIATEFHVLFGIQLPIGSDQAAAGVMIARKKAGKLDVKSPLAYLNSLSGKVQPILPTPAQLNPESQMLVKPTTKASLPVTETRLDHEAMARVDAIWDAMDHSQYKEKALAKDQTGKKYPVPIELLARSIFNAEMMNQQGGQYGKEN